ncbi:MAG: GatB/YqeY domain-containing protein [Rhizobiaceae bacterium]
MRNKISESLKAAMKAKDSRRVATLRLVNAAIQDRDISLRGKGKDRADDEEVMDILAKMVKQREESSQLYREGNRPELEAQELEEMAIIKEYLPQPLSEEESEKAISTAIAETGAQSLRDMGKVMGWLKEHYRGKMDMGKTGPAVKKLLGG